MRNIAFAFTLAAACLAATPALAADAKLTWKDLDLTSEAGKAELDRRIDAAAQQVCAPQAVTGSRIVARTPAPACLAEAREQMTAQIAARTERDRRARAQASAAR